MTKTPAIVGDRGPEAILTRVQVTLPDVNLHLRAACQAERCKSGRPEPTWAVVRLTCSCPTRLLCSPCAERMREVIASCGDALIDMVCLECYKATNRKRARELYRIEPL